MRNLLIDLRFGRPLGGTFFSMRNRTNSYSPFATNSDYVALTRIFEDQVMPSDVLVDIGCGHGRVINHWLRHYSRNQIIGIECFHDIAARTRERLKSYDNVKIITGNALEALPENGSLFYFYNPFGPESVQLLKQQFCKLFDRDQKVKFLYYNCRHVDIFECDPAWTVTRVNIGGGASSPFSELAILKMS